MPGASQLIFIWLFTRAVDLCDRSSKYLALLNLLNKVDLVTQSSILTRDVTPILQSDWPPQHLCAQHYRQTPRPSLLILKSCGGCGLVSRVVLALVSLASSFTRGEEGSGQLRITGLCCRVSSGLAVQGVTSDLMLMSVTLIICIVLDVHHTAQCWCLQCG